jgi:ribosomal protein S18 acetylase RimI-like enzyme
MVIRPASDADVPALQALLRASWLTTWAPHLKPETVARFHQTDEAGTYALTCWQHFGLAEDDGAIRGMFHIDGHHLNAIHLDPALKRRGIGSFLMDEVERRISVAHKEATLEVLAFNTQAIAFYEHRAWQQGRRYETLECGERVETIEMTKRFA